MSKILIISDIENRAFFNCNLKSIKCVDFIISSGDLSIEYLRWIREITNKPIYYLYGNHTKNTFFKPKDITYIGNKIVKVFGLTIAGIDGIEYTDSKKIHKSVNRLQNKKRKLDILVTHCPTQKLGDGLGYHAGCAEFYQLYREKEVKIHIYGHNHLSYGGSRYLEFEGTKLYNAYDHFIIEV